MPARHVAEQVILSDLLDALAQLGEDDPDPDMRDRLDALDPAQLDRLRSACIVLTGQIQKAIYRHLRNAVARYREETTP